MSENEKERLSGDIRRSDSIGSAKGEGGNGNGSASLLPTVNPSAEKPADKPGPQMHPVFYVVAWISLSSSVILFNKYILDTGGFPFPIILTTWHLAFGTLMTQILARTTTLLDGRKTVKMTGRVYLRAIVPIGVFFSLSLICGNVTYLYLSVAFIQMLKATTPVAVLFATWMLGLAQPSLKVFLNVLIIVVGVVIASFGEIKFVFVGFMYQLGGIVFEAIRLVMVQRLLSSAEYKMDPLVSFYYFAPICAVMNGVVALFAEVPRISFEAIQNVGLGLLLLNAIIAFLLNVSVVFLIGRTSSLVLTLCGVLKDILLVIASIAIWGTPVTGLQFFGYSLALVGMVYYKLGAETLRTYLADGSRRWAEYGVNHPAQRKVVVFVIVLFTLFIILGGLAPVVGYDPTNVVQTGKGYFSGALPAGQGKTGGS